jgi:hypothetical protein
MSKTKISEFDSNPANNTDIDGINLAEGMAPGLVNNAIRELMAQLKDFQAGSAGDNVTVGGNLVVTGTGTLGGRPIDAFPSGTKMLFNQTTAPTGWTKDTTHNDKALRVVSGTAGTGGSVAFTTAFASQNVGATTLNESQIPGHTHGVSGNTGNNNVGHTHGFSGTTASAGNHSHTWPYGTFTGSGYPGFDGSGDAFTTGNTGVAGDHSHSFSGTTGGISANHIHSFNVTSASTGGGGSHTHSLNIAVSYVDVIIATKN